MTTPTERINRTAAWVRKFSNHKQTVDKLERLRFCEASLVTNVGIKPVYMIRPKAATLHKMTAECWKRGVEPWWMTFPHSIISQIDEHLDDLKRHLFDTTTGVDQDLAIPKGLDIDAENPHDSIGWGPSGAKDQVARRLLKGYWDMGFRDLHVTFVIFRKGLRKQDRALLDVAREIGFHVRIAPQGYSKDDPSKTWDDGNLFRPGNMQNFIMDHVDPLIAEGLIKPEDMYMGAMFLYQNHPEPWPDDIEALRMAHDTAFARGVRSWKYWTLGQAGSKDGDQDFIREAPYRQDENPYVFVPDEADQPHASRKQDVKALQTLLNRNGYPCGKADGLIGARTKEATATFKRDADLIPKDVNWEDRPKMLALAEAVGL